MPLNTTPDRATVAAKIPDHTYDRGGTRLNDFRETGDPPTQNDADQAITVAAGIIRGRVGRIPATADDTDERWTAVAAMLLGLTATRAAMELVRNISVPEYDRLLREYTDLLPDVRAALQQAACGEDPAPAGTPSAAWSFPAASTTLDEGY